MIMQDADQKVPPTITKIIAAVQLELSCLKNETD